MAHLDSYLAALEVRLDDDLLNRIDEIVGPGTNVNQLDGRLAAAGDHRPRHAGGAA